MTSKSNEISKQSVKPESYDLVETEDVSIPDVDVLIIEILTDQMINFDESSTDILEIFHVTKGIKKRFEVKE